MTTPEQELREIVEEVPGGCWHEQYTKNYIVPEDDCKKCGELLTSFPKYRNGHLKHPSPTDLNVISEYEKKLGYRVKVAQYSDGFYVCLATGEQSIDDVHYLISHEGTEVDARRKALYAAIKEK